VGLLGDSSAISCLSHDTTQVHAATERPKIMANIATAVMRERERDRQIESGPLHVMFTAL